MAVARLLLNTGKVLFTSNKKKIKAALDKGAKKLTQKESEKLLKMGFKGTGGAGTVGKFLQKAERGDRGLEIDSPFFVLYNIVKGNFKTNLFGRATQGALLGRAEHVGEETGNYRRIFRNQKT